MIFGWLQDGKTDRWVLVDAVFPWPALHDGRNAIRLWADHQNSKRVLEHTPGPRRCPWPCKTTVKEDGEAELRIWPCEIYAKPRAWGMGDIVWSAPMVELSEVVAAGIGCPVVLDWMGGSEIERAVTKPSLRGRGFLCWGKGEHEPTARQANALKEIPLRVGTAGMDLRIMPQGDDAWL